MAKLTFEEIVAKSAKTVADADKRVLDAAIAEVEAGKPLGEIADVMGVSAVTLRKRLDGAGVKLDLKRGRKSAFTEDAQLALVARVVDGGENRTNVAAEAGVREGTLYSWQKKHRPESIKTREAVEAEPETVNA